ncbi:hypothetical protein [Pseudopedobacter beijingensis]|uniref:Fumarate hydratase n=1 Tax=Pseudopedobacter beijingensis TaxID=1207056 RepID=A0ABW4I993_9SPHI
MVHKLLLSVFLAFLCCSCKFNPRVDNTGDSTLQGIWDEDKKPFEEKLASVEKYKLKFICDSFYLDIKSHTRVNLDAGECYSRQEWSEYVKGTYVRKDDFLYLTGSFVNEHYRYKPQGSCYRFGKYEEKFLISQQGTDSLELRNTLTGITHLVILKQRVDCKNNQE